MPTFKLDGLDVPFEAGDTIIKAAHRVGIDIPHYCWHPGLSVAANCRMCLVEIGPPPGRKPLMLDVFEWDRDRQDYVQQRKPKLQPACQQAAVEGLDVRSQTSDHAKRARAAVQELLLLNHPVDCPICDQAGECRLQDYWLEHGTRKKRMLDERVRKPKAVVFGPTIVYDAERCIVCTRCVRFVEEVAKDPCLAKRERGNLSEIVLSPGRKLDNAYTLMTEYVCPVGALTAQDFRFKARVWFLRSARSVCVGCATGCNDFADYDPRNQTVYRYRPRENMQVNRYWMCDEGMLDYQRIHQGRVETALVSGKPVARDKAIQKAAKLLDGAHAETLAVVLSAEHSNEDNNALLSVVQGKLGASQVFIAGRPDGEGDDILRDKDKNPNRAGVVALAGAAPHSVADLFKAVETGKVTHIVSLGSQAFGSSADDFKALKNVTRIAFATHSGPLTSGAEVVLPAGSWVESEGTFVNRKGLHQQAERVISAVGDARPAWKLVSELAAAVGKPLDFKRVRDVQRSMLGGDAPVATRPSEKPLGAPV